MPCTLLPWLEPVTNFLTVVMAPEDSVLSGVREPSILDTVPIPVLVPFVAAGTLREKLDNDVAVQRS